MAPNDDQRPPGELVLYQGQGLDDPIQVRLAGETVWLSQKLIAELYGVAVPTINEHISNVYDDEELWPEATIRKFRIVQTEGGRQVKRLVDHYNLAMILAVGFRVRSSVTGIRHLNNAELASHDNPIESNTLLDLSFDYGKSMLCAQQETTRLNAAIEIDLTQPGFTGDQQWH